MNISSINLFKSNNISKTDYLKLNNFINNINFSMPFDTVSFSGKILYFDDYKGNRHSDDYAIWLTTPHDEDDEESPTPLEEAFLEQNIDYIAGAIDKLSTCKYDEYGNLYGCDKVIKDGVILYCIDIINNMSPYVKDESKDYIADVLDVVLKRADEKLLLDLTDYENSNNILSNLVSTNNLEAIKTVFNNCSNETIAKLMLEKNVDEQYPIGEYNTFNKSRKILGAARMTLDGIPLFSGRKIKLSTTFLLRSKAVEILEDENIPIELKYKIYKVYIPNKSEKESYVNNRFVRQFEEAISAYQY